MKKTKSLSQQKPILYAPLANQQGMVLVISLMLLVVLSLMATSAIQLSNIEQAIATSSEVSQHNFYSLETAAIEAIVQIENTPDQVLKDLTPTWLALDDQHLKDIPQLDNPLYEFNFRVSGHWNAGANISPQETSLNDIRPTDYGAGDRIRYVVIDTGLAPGASWSTPGEETHAYAVYSVYDVDTGTTYPGRKILAMGHTKKLNL